jgi:ribosomal protein L7/L12
MERMEERRTEPSVTAIAHLHQGNKIAAIKQVREEQGLDLKEAKDLVDRYLAAHPELSAHEEAAAGMSAGKFVLGLIVAVLAIVAAYYALKTM